MSTGTSKAEWRRSKFCNGGECIEVAVLPGGNVGLRTAQWVGVVTAAEFDAFLLGAKAGEFDELTE